MQYAIHHTFEVTRLSSESFLQYLLQYEVTGGLYLVLNDTGRGHYVSLEVVVWKDNAHEREREGEG